MQIKICFVDGLYIKKPHLIKHCVCLIYFLCILSFPFPSHAAEPDTYVPVTDESVYDEIVTNSAGEQEMEQLYEEHTVTFEHKMKELQKREMLNDNQISDMAIELYEKDDNKIFIMYSSGELGINAIEYRKLQREIESLRKSKESKKKIEENEEEANEETEERNTVFADPREYEKFDVWEIVPLVVLIIGLEFLLALYRPFEDEMLYK